jgi:hypothetical protein
MYPGKNYAINMPQTEAITTRQHNVPVRENMSRGLRKKLGYATRHNDGYGQGDFPWAFIGGGSKVVNRARYRNRP